MLGEKTFHMGNLLKQPNIHKSYADILVHNFSVLHRKSVNHECLKMRFTVYVSLVLVFVAICIICHIRMVCSHCSKDMEV